MADQSETPGREHESTVGVGAELTGFEKGGTTDGVGSLEAGRSRKATDQSGDLRMENPEGVKKGGQGPGQSGRRTDGSEGYVEGGGTQERADGTGKERKFQEDGKGDKVERKTAHRCDKRRIGVIQACVDQRRDPRRRSEEGEEQEQDRKLRRREQWKSIRRLMKIGDDRRIGGGSRRREWGDVGENGSWGCQDRSVVSRVENVSEKEDMAHGCGSWKDDWLVEEEELEVKEEAEMETASEEKISGGRSRVIGRNARRNACDSKRRRWRHGSDSLVCKS